MLAGTLLMGVSSMLIQSGQADIVVLFADVKDWAALLVCGNSGVSARTGLF